MKSAVVSVPPAVRAGWLVKRHRHPATGRLPRLYAHETRRVEGVVIVFRWAPAVEVIGAASTNGANIPTPRVCLDVGPGTALKDAFRPGRTARGRSPNPVSPHRNAPSTLLCHCLTMGEREALVQSLDRKQSQFQMEPNRHPALAIQRVAEEPSRRSSTRPPYRKHISGIHPHYLQHQA